MRLPIPNDWNNEEWGCFIVRWPDSPQWRAILRGLLYQQTRGRLWDENTGTITDVQKIGYEIFNKNVPLTRCDRLKGPETPQDDTGYSQSEIEGLAGILCGESEIAELEYLMNGPCPPIKIENGNLYWWQCCEWQLIGPLATVAEIVVEPWQPDEQGVYPAFSACGKAKAVHDAIVAVADGMWDARADVPWAYFGNVGARLPGYNLSKTWVLNGVLEAIKLDIITGETDIFDEESLQRVLCRIETIMSADQSPLTSDQYSQIKGFYSGEFGPLGGGNLYLYAIAAIGKDNLSTIAALGAIDTTSNCECPSAPVGTYWENELSYALDFFSPNQTIDHEVTVAGQVVNGGMIAVVVYAEGGSSGNGSADWVDCGPSQRIVNPVTPYSRTFAMYATAEGQRYLNLYYPGVQQISGLVADCLSDGQMTIRTNGNNVRILATGTIRQVFKTSEVPPP